MKKDNKFWEEFALGVIIAICVFVAWIAILVALDVC